MWTKPRTVAMSNFVQLIIFIVAAVAITAEPCNRRQFSNETSFVCVCDDALGCGFIGQITPPLDGFYNFLTSTMADLRFDLKENNVFVPPMNTTVALQIFINISDVRQRMYGFGGAFTDSAGIVVSDLSPSLQDVFVKQYFSPDGLEYNMGRVPIAGSDFSTRPYSYDDVVGDVDLLFFNLTFEDHLYKIPLIKRAEEFSGRPINLYASPWSPPSWMKENGMFNGSGGILTQYLQPWANYFVKFLDAYIEEEVSLWGLTVQNEAANAGITDYPWNCCHFTAEEERDFVKGFLGPTLNVSGYRPLKLMITDDSRNTFPAYATTILSDPLAAEYVDGIAAHWYSDDYFPASLLTETHNRFPEKFILYTEACTGYSILSPNSVGRGVKLGSWERAESYASNIIEDVNHWATGWVDWNLALNMEGGPNWADNNCDAPIIVNGITEEFYKQPMFYAMGHFSKFVPEGSYLLATTVTLTQFSSKLRKDDVQAATFIDPAGYVVLVILNKSPDDESVAITDSSGKEFLLVLPARSIQTIVYNSAV